MGAFEYRALDERGKETKGLIEGETARAVRSMLRERKLLPVAVSEVAERKTRSRSQHGGSFALRRGLSTTDRALVTRQLATMVRAGLPLDEALQAVAESTDKSAIQRILLGVRAKVLEGHTLATGMGDFPHAFPELFRATIGAGEQSGHLDQVLERLAEYTEKEQETRGKITEALVYPALLTVAAVAIVTFLMLKVMPDVIGVFEDMQIELPTLTRVLIALSNFMQSYLYFLAGGIVVVAVVVYLLLQQPGPRRAWHRTLLRLPLIGKFVRAANTSQFSRTLSILASSGVPVLTALNIGASVITNLPMREAVEVAAERVREGAAIGKSLAVSKLFPPMTMRLISSGEASGELEDMLERAAIAQEHELDSLRKLLTTALAPMMILLMGGVVLSIVLAILMPIFELNTQF